MTLKGELVCPCANERQSLTMVRSSLCEPEHRRWVICHQQPLPVYNHYNENCWHVQSQAEAPRCEGVVPVDSVPCRAEQSQ